VILRVTGRVAHDAFENLEDGSRLHPETGFFKYLPLDGRGEKFAGLDQSAGQRPAAFQRLPSALDQQDGIPAENQRADAQ